MPGRIAQGRASVLSRPSRGLWLRLWHRSLLCCSSLACLWLRAGMLLGLHFSSPSYVRIRPAPERAPSIYRDCDRGTNQFESQPAIERSERYANLSGGLLRAIGLFHVTPFSLRPHRAMSSTSKRMRQSLTLFRLSLASRARSGPFPFPPSACHTLSR